MIRFVRLPDGRVEVDLSGKKSGRGANMAMISDHIDLAFKKKAFERALKLESPLSSEDQDRLRSEFNEAIEQKQFRKGRERVTIKVSKQDFEKATGAAA
ncbi:MAG: hypothetical protein TR69_WS6001001146 [candidate division WS6 bacterium OLB20]|uniref:YlxR domain-containing protein n=1 Tax=candidate division WS6 bacterium OLB20 TaxID=1617426 RepID=A0A136LWW7_9BACT|nr:MAG: hypothetical protein TR69_WS6001001146 [candidate division WS6 bacterium OLB20]